MLPSCVGDIIWSQSLYSNDQAMELTYQGSFIQMPNLVPGWGLAVIHDVSIPFFIVSADKYILN